MAYDIKLADRIREYLIQFPKLKIEEKEMFRGLTFMINGKMCVCVSGENLMCRFDPDLTEFPQWASCSKEMQHRIVEAAKKIPMSVCSRSFFPYVN